MWGTACQKTFENLDNYIMSTALFLSMYSKHRERILRDLLGKSDIS